MNLWGNRHTVTCNRTVYSHMKENHYKIIMETEEGGLFFVISLIRLLPEVSVPRSLKVPELCTPISQKKIIQWLYKLNRTSTHSDIFPLCRMAEWLEPISCHDNPA